MPKTPFLGPSYQSRSPNLAANRAWNVFAEPVEAPRGTGAEVGAFYSRPGLDLKLTVGVGPIRGACSTDFGLFVVSGNKAYKITTGLVATLLGTLGTSMGVVYVIANTNQVAFFDGVNGFAWSVATGWITIALPFTKPGRPVYQDGFVLINEVGSIRVWQCNLNDLTTWNALTVSTEDGSAGNVMALGELHRQVIVFKETDTAFWINIGSSPFAFQRLEGVYPAKGCLAPASVVNGDDKVGFLGQSDEGEGVFYVYSGYTPERISTFAIEYQIAQYATLSDCIGLSFLMEGHTFYVWTFPTANATWVFDITASERLKTPMWYQWGGFVGGQLIRWAPNCMAAFAGMVLVGDYQNGNIYALDMNTLTDNGAIKKCLRSWRHTGDAAYQTSKCNFLNIECDTGFNVAPNGNPQIVLRQSFDGGQSWSPEMYQAAGVSGATAQYVNFTRLGATRRGLNSERIFELSTTDQWRVGWLGAEAG